MLLENGLQPAVPIQEQSWLYQGKNKAVRESKAGVEDGQFTERGSAGDLKTV